MTGGTEPLFHLAPGWRLASDGRQWMVQRFRETLKPWYPVAFVVPSKAVLPQVLREKGVELMPDAQRAIDLLPNSFNEWMTQRSSQAQATKGEDQLNLPFEAAD